jgi:hypothetical protein
LNAGHSGGRVYVFENVPAEKREYRLMSFEGKYEKGMRKERK